MPPGRVAPAWLRAFVALLAVVALWGFAAAEDAASAPGAEAPWLPARSMGQADPRVTVLSQAQFCRRQGEAVPGDDCVWQDVALGYIWPPTPGAALSDGWFRLRFHLDAVPAGSLGLYIVAFNRTGALWVNGHYMRQFGNMTPPLPLSWNRSQYLVMPPSQLRAGDNEIEILQRTYDWERGWLSPVRIGPEPVLRATWERRVFWQNQLVLVLGATTAAMGLFMLGVWIGRRDQAAYFWFGIASLLWTLISLDYFAAYPPLPAHAWEDLIESSQVLRTACMYMFILRYVRVRLPWLEAAIWIYALAGTAALDAGVLRGVNVDRWYLVTLASSFWFAWLLVREGLRRSVLEGTLLFLATAVQIVLSGYDLWLFAQHTWTDRVYVAHFGSPLYLFVVGGLLMRRFVESLNAYEKLAAVLEQRVAEKAQELARNYEQLGEARRAEAIARERARIMSEMHDGIGSQLTLALSLVRGTHGEDARVATVLRESIEDLQLIIDSLEPVENDLLTVLGTLRYRLQDRLSKSGIELQWNVVDLPPLPVLTPHSVLSILRIVQEAFANCLKHSGATRITVSTGLSGTPGQGETASIAIVDDGHGIDGARPGRGLENMRRRADALGGRLMITSRAGRTEIRLDVPTLRPAPGVG